MRLEIQEEALPTAGVAELETNAAAGKALEAGRALDRRRMDARRTTLTLRVRRLRRFRRGIVPALRWPGWVSVLMMIGGFAFLIPAVFVPNYLFAPLAAYAGRVMIGGIVLFALILAGGATLYSICQSQEFAVRKQARREGLELDE